MGKKLNFGLGLILLFKVVSHYLYEILSTAQYGELKEKIKNVVDRAIEVWRPIQMLRKDMRQNLILSIGPTRRTCYSSFLWAAKIQSGLITKKTTFLSFSLDCLAWKMMPLF